MGDRFDHRPFLSSKRDLVIQRAFHSWSSATKSISRIVWYVRMTRRCLATHHLSSRFNLVKHKAGVQVITLYSTNLCYSCSVFDLEKSNVPYFETSAKEGINVEKAFETVARNALAREKDIDQGTDFPAPIRIPEQNQPAPSSGCPC